MCSTQKSQVPTCFCQLPEGTGGPGRGAAGQVWKCRPWAGAVGGGEAALPLTPLPFARSHCIQQILEAVLHCHQMGVVHRDLKVSVSPQPPSVPLPSSWGPHSLGVALAWWVLGSHWDLAGLGDPLSSEHSQLPSPFPGDVLVSPDCGTVLCCWGLTAAPMGAVNWWGRGHGVGAAQLGWGWLRAGHEGMVVGHGGGTRRGDTGGCWFEASETRGDPELAMELCHPAPWAIGRGHPWPQPHSTELADGSMAAVKPLHLPRPCSLSPLCPVLSVPSRRTCSWPASAKGRR